MGSSYSSGIILFVGLSGVVVGLSVCEVVTEGLAFSPSDTFVPYNDSRLG